MKQIAIFLIRIYQKLISPLFPATCRFSPTCSAYAVQAIQRFGFFRGIYLATRRILRCHPFCNGGIDPVPTEFHFRYPKKK